MYLCAFLRLFPGELEAFKRLATGDRYRCWCCFYWHHPQHRRGCRMVAMVDSLLLLLIVAFSCCYGRFRCFCLEVLRCYLAGLSCSVRLGSSVVRLLPADADVWPYCSRTTKLTTKTTITTTATAAECSKLATTAVNHRRCSSGQLRLQRFSKCSSKNSNGRDLRVPRTPPASERRNMNFNCFSVKHDGRARHARELN